MMDSHALVADLVAAPDEASSEFCLLTNQTSQSEFVRRSRSEVVAFDPVLDFARQVSLGTAAAHSVAALDPTLGDGVPKVMRAVEAAAGPVAVVDSTLGDGAPKVAPAVLTTAKPVVALVSTFGDALPKVPPVVDTAAGPIAVLNHTLHDHGIPNVVPTVNTVVGPAAVFDPTLSKCAQTVVPVVKIATGKLIPVVKSAGNAADVLQALCDRNALEVLADESALVDPLIVPKLVHAENLDVAPPHSTDVSSGVGLSSISVGLVTTAALPVSVVRRMPQQLAVPQVDRNGFNSALNQPAGQKRKWTPEAVLATHVRQKVETPSLTSPKVKAAKYPTTCPEPECDVLLRSIGEHARHERTHTNETSCACAICGKQFKRIGCLKRHEVVHNPEKSFACQFCHRRFSFKSAAVRHETKSCSEAKNGAPPVGERPEAANPAPPALPSVQQSAPTNAVIMPSQVVELRTLQGQLLGYRQVPPYVRYIQVNHLLTNSHPPDT
eukprot:m.120331 g.120331  ORF g.120331 m.120331 type:complete len:495 (-) comp13340_c0_seq5:5441-6925(-)